MLNWGWVKIGWRRINFSYLCNKFKKNGFMKNNILFIAIMATVTLSAQTTFDLDWAIGINGEDASLTIETGDTVRWTWTDEV